MSIINESYKQNNLKENSRLTHTICAAHGKTLFFSCTAGNNEKKYELFLQNKNGKVVFNTAIKEEDIVQLAKSINTCKELF